jgi:prepilin-type N-terminal cleavage/methylation domain-containing protein/prepilin-type processing-associated H-X9-DG protein
MGTIYGKIWRKKATCRRGFTLVELLVVIAIIGILIGLLLPAVNAARESGRLIACSNNVRQMAVACLALESDVGYLPGGGWGWEWAGEPDRGYGVGQPGGWHFNILPFTEYKGLHDMGKGAPTQAVRMAQGLQQSMTAVPTFICPSRYNVHTFPRTHSTQFLNISDPRPRVVGRSDYAANAGSNFTGAGDGGPNPSYSASFNWASVEGTMYNSAEPATGVIFRASALPLVKIKDGTSRTYMIGERYLSPDCYNTSTCCDNDQGWDMGYDYDTNRGTAAAPMRDEAGYSGCMTIFGSAHAAGFNMAFCDGSVRKINYEIEPNIHLSLGHRADGQPVNSSSWAN